MIGHIKKHIETSSFETHKTERAYGVFSVFKALSLSKR